MESQIIHLFTSDYSPFQIRYQRHLQLAWRRHQGLPGCPWPKRVPQGPGTSSWGSGLGTLSLSPECYMLLPPGSGSSRISRGLSLLASGTLASWQLGLSRCLPKGLELLEELTLPRAVPVTQEKQPPSAPSGANLPILCHRNRIQRKTRALPERVPGSQDTKKSGLRPSGPRRFTERVSMLKASGRKHV